MRKMNNRNSALTISQHTNFYHENNPTGKRSCTIKGSDLVLSYSPMQYEEKIVTESRIRQEIESRKSISSMTFKEITKNNSKLMELKKTLGLNIFEISTIFQVSRPTIYQWMESENIKIRRKHQERLDEIYEVSQVWEKKNIGDLRSYLHKSINEKKISLFDLLKTDILNKKIIIDHLSQIAKYAETKKQKNKMHCDLLKKHGFDPAKEEDKDDRLNDIDFLE